MAIGDATFASLVAELRVDDAALTSGLNRAETSLRTTERRFRELEARSDSSNFKIGRFSRSLYLIGEAAGTSGGQFAGFVLQVENANRALTSMAPRLDRIATGLAAGALAAIAYRKELADLAIATSDLLTGKGEVDIAKATEIRLDTKLRRDNEIREKAQRKQEKQNAKEAAERRKGLSLNRNIGVEEFQRNNQLTFAERQRLGLTSPKTEIEQFRDERERRRRQEAFEERVAAIERSRRLDLDESIARVREDGAFRRARLESDLSREFTTSSGGSSASSIRFARPGSSFGVEGKNNVERNTKETADLIKRLIQLEERQVAALERRGGLGGGGMAP